MTTEFAKAIVQALSEADEVYQDGGYIDDDDLSNTCIDGWFNLERVAEKLIAKGYGPATVQTITPSHYDCECTTACKHPFDR